MESQESLKPFRIRNLLALSDTQVADRAGSRHGVVRVSAPEYDETISNQPDATLMYLDEDDGEVITVGSSFELAQRLDEPTAVKPARRSSRPQPFTFPSNPTLAYSTSPTSPQMHIFDINRSNVALDVWRGIEQRTASREAEPTVDSSLRVNPFSDHATISNAGESDLSMHFHPSDNIFRLNDPEDDRERWLRACNPPRLSAENTIVGPSFAPAQTEDRKVPKSIENSTVECDLSTLAGERVVFSSGSQKSRLGYHSSLTAEGKRQAQEAGAKFHWKKSSDASSIGDVLTSRMTHENRWASYKEPQAESISDAVSNDTPRNVQKESHTKNSQEESRPLLEAFEAEMAKLIRESTTQGNNQEGPKLNLLSSSRESPRPSPQREESSSDRIQAQAGDILVQTVRSLVDGVSTLGSELRHNLPQFEQHLAQAQQSIPDTLEHTVRGALQGLGDHIQSLAQSMQEASQATQNAAERTREVDLRAVEGAFNGIRGFLGEVGDMGKTLFSAFEAEFSPGRSGEHIEIPSAPEASAADSRPKEGTQDVHIKSMKGPHEPPATHPESREPENFAQSVDIPRKTTEPTTKVNLSRSHFVPQPVEFSISDQQGEQCSPDCTIGESRRHKYCVLRKVSYAPRHSHHYEGLTRESATSSAPRPPYVDAVGPSGYDVRSARPGPMGDANYWRHTRSRSPPAFRRPHTGPPRYPPPGQPHRSHFDPRVYHGPPMWSRPPQELSPHDFIPTWNEGLASPPRAHFHDSSSITTSNMSNNRKLTSETANIVPVNANPVPILKPFPNRQSLNPSVKREVSHPNLDDNLKSKSSVTFAEPVNGETSEMFATPKRHRSMGALRPLRRHQISMLSGQSDLAKDSLYPLRVIALAHNANGHDGTQAFDKHSEVINAAQEGLDRITAAKSRETLNTKPSSSMILDQEDADPEFSARYPSLISSNNLRRANTIASTSKPVKSSISALNPESEMARFPTVTQFEEQRLRDTQAFPMIPSAELREAPAPPSLMQEKLSEQGKQHLTTVDPETNIIKPKAINREVMETINKRRNGEVSSPDPVEVDHTQNLPGSWPLQNSEPVVAESSGEFFRRMTGLNSSPNDLKQAQEPKSQLHRSKSMTTARDPAATLSAPFDPLAGKPGTDGKYWEDFVARKKEELRRRKTEYQSNRNDHQPRRSSTRRPYSERFSGNGRIGWDSFLETYGKTPGGFPAEDAGLYQYPLVPPKTTVDVPSRPTAEGSSEDFRKQNTPKEDAGSRQSRTESYNGFTERQSAPYRHKSKVDVCVTHLMNLGFAASLGQIDRLKIYAEAAGGDLEDAIEMIEEERKAYQQRPDLAVSGP